MSDSSSKMVFFLLKNAMTIMISFHSGFNDIIEFKENLQKKRLPTKLTVPTGLPQSFFKLSKRKNNYQYRHEKLLVKML
jgi:hypothetical protein